MRKQLYTQFSMVCDDHPCYDFQWQFNCTDGVRAWVCNHIPLFYVDVITHSYPNTDAGLAYFPQQKRHLVDHFNRRLMINEKVFKITQSKTKDFMS